MRTTLNVDPDVMVVIKYFSEERHVSLGQAASDLILLGAESIPQFEMKNGWVVFDEAPGMELITNEMIAKLQEEDDEEEFRRAISPRR